MVYQKALVPRIKTKDAYTSNATPVAQPAQGEVHATPIHVQHDSPSPIPHDDHGIDVIPYDDDELEFNGSEITDAHIRHMYATNVLPYQIYMSSDPFEDTVEIEKDTRGYHATLGLITSINKDMGHRPQIIDYKSRHQLLEFQSGGQH